jgi:DNA-directed RNA polymerase II subunit RPB1
VELTAKVMACVCFSCGKLKLDRESTKFKQVLAMKKPKNRLNLLYKYSREIRQCGKENRETSEIENGCGYRNPKLRRKGLEIHATFKREENDEEISDTQREIMPDEALEVLERISEEDCKILGFNADRGHPSWMIIRRLPVAPPCVRPSVEMMSNQRSEDDLTTQYISIIKTNNTLRQREGAAAHLIKDDWFMLQFYCATLVNNDLSGQPKARNKTGGKAIKSIRERLKGKEGRLRGNLMGKRVDFSARTVITPDPNLALD